MCVSETQNEKSLFSTAWMVHAWTTLISSTLPMVASDCESRNEGIWNRTWNRSMNVIFNVTQSIMILIYVKIAALQSSKTWLGSIYRTITRWNHVRLISWARMDFQSYLIAGHRGENCTATKKKKDIVRPKLALAQMYIIWQYFLITDLLACLLFSNFLYIISLPLSIPHLAFWLSWAPHGWCQ